MVRITINDNVAKLKEKSKAKSTQDKYEGDWLKFIDYCKKKYNCNPLDVDDLESAYALTANYMDWLHEDPEAKVLIGTNSKVGTGFDHPKLNTLILAADVEEYYVQYMGRIFRTKEGTPIIFDMVDNNPTLEKHFKTFEIYTAVDSPSISGFVARMTSFISGLPAFSFNPAMFRSSGPMPSRGEITPIKT